MIKNVHRWTRLSSLKWEDAWEERLRFLAPEQLAFITWPDSRALKIEAYCDERTARRLVARFGGRSTRIAPHLWTGDPQRPRAPLPIRGRLKVFSDEASWAAARKTPAPRGGGKTPVPLLIPAGMAFGTGEHATTATCLRFLCDLVPSLPPGFSLLDLGTGSGILAIAAETLGAGHIDAIDFDPVAIRITSQNAAKNRCRRITPAVGDALKLTARNRYHVVVANLFSDLLIASAPRIVRSIKPGGTLIFSGVLRSQSPEVAAAFQKQGLSTPRIVTRGKWCAGICKKPC